MTKVNKGKIVEYSILCALILFQCIYFWNCYIDVSPSGDEWFTYGLANDTDERLFMDSDWIYEKSNGTGWIPVKCIRDYFIVNSGEEYDFATVIRNQKNDVHPPLYYILIHFFSSLNPDKLPFRVGTYINLFFLIAINIVLYKMGDFFFDTWYEKLIPLYILVMSQSIRVLLWYDRMYMMLCFFCICLTYLQLVLQKNMYEKKTLIGIALITLMGCLTHYYFYIYLFVAFCVFSLECIVKLKKKTKDLLPCIVAHCAGGVMALLLYPTAIRHVLFSYRAEEIQNSLFGDKVEGFIVYYKIINKYCFDRHLIEFIILLILLFLFGKIVNKKYTNISCNGIRILFGTIMAFYVIMSFISYEKLWAYISPLFVLLAFVIGWSTVSVLSFCKKNILRVLLTILIVACVFQSSMLYRAYMLFIGSQSKYEEVTVNDLISEQKGKDCIFVYEQWNALWNDRILELLNFDEVFPISLDELKTVSLDDECMHRKTEDELILYLWNNDEVNGQLRYIEESLKCNLNCIWEDERYIIYSIN